MRVLGLDLSTAKSGYGLGTDGGLDLVGLWKPPAKIKTQEAKIDFMTDHAKALMFFERPDIVVIEVCAPQRNAETFRALVRVEATVSREARQLGLDVLLVRVSAVREAAMGDGKMGKETVYRKIVEQYPQFDWKPIDKGGDDMTDAAAMVIAGPRLADRR